MSPPSAQQLQEQVASAGLQMGDDATTLLRYALLPDPNPLQVSAEHARLTLVISNPRAQLVACTRIEVTLPVGTTPRTLITATTFQNTAPEGWSAATDGGTIVLTPSTPDAGQVGRAGLALEIAALRVNAEPGIARVTIDETASAGSAPAETRTAAIEVPKFPRQFQVGGLIADPLEVPYDGTSVISWSGSPASYTLLYRNAQGSRTVDNLPPVGTHTATNLVSFPCVFTLVVKVVVGGLDKPLTLQRQISVTAAPKLAITSFESSAGNAAPGAPLTFRWQTQFATTLSLRIARGEGSVDVSRVRGCTLTLAPGDGKRFEVTGPDGARLGSIGLPPAVESSLTFLLSASDGTSTVQASFDMTVRPVKADLWAKYHGYMGWTLEWKVTDQVGDVEIKPLGKVNPGDSGRRVPRDTYTLTANGFWGPVVRTVDCRNRG